ncbi:MAG: 16S rRNA (guanine(966)-N(2))-methyltransferase RsmD [candidate division Zixibacteria bacterium RBG_16_53_22]|nr:MAG: 16S rRNA (guanine(966)-N(2))-methyltransferase RsmD [candidate division Zixibacteria bacterium RBG_16_53_22]
MKIAGGQYKGRIIKVPKIRNIRPSTEKTREAIFSALGADIIDSTVADLFCGSGALGLEALSRGACQALFVDSNHGAAVAVRESIKGLGVGNESRVMTMNVFHLRPKHLQGVGIIFADPPYRGGYARKLLTLLSLPNFNWYGILILEHEAEWENDGIEFRLLRRLNFGDTSVSFLIRNRLDEKAGHQKGNSDG